MRARRFLILRFALGTRVVTVNPGPAVAGYVLDDRQYGAAVQQPLADGSGEAREVRFHKPGDRVRPATREIQHRQCNRP
jgi:hypothetical protein